MQELDDSTLLREYVERDSEEAFAALVTRHVNKVYSVALRLTGNPHSAEEITQAVFVILARKSRQLGKRVILSGWLYQTARLTAVTFVRGSIRRARREQEACMQTALNENESDAWVQIAPLMDAAMAGLNETDRHAVVLRFFDGKSLREVGAALGANEEAAKKRVSRALEKLRTFFAKRGVSSTTAIIAGAISAHSVQAAPVTLAKAVTAIAVTKGAVAGGSTLTLIKGALKIMAWTKAKTVIVVGTSVLLAAGTTMITVKEIQEHRAYPWQVRNTDIGKVLNQTPPQVKIVPTIFPPGDGYTRVNGKVLGTGISIRNLLNAAYRTGWYRTVATTQLPEKSYDFIANLPDGNEAALRQEITRQFHLVGRTETREADVLLLTTKSRNARGLKPSTMPPSQGANQIRDGAGYYKALNATLNNFARFLENSLEIPIIDRTGIEGRFDFDFNFRWDEPDRQNRNPERLKPALLDQLGLELVPSREPIEMLVVEKVQ